MEAELRRALASEEVDSFVAPRCRKLRKLQANGTHTTNLELPL